MIFWAAVSAAMVVVAVVVYLNPEATVELLGGRVRSGLAMAGVFALPPVIFVVSVVMIARRKQRWRVRGGGVLTNPIVVGVDAGFPTTPLVSAIRGGSDDQIMSELTAAHRRLGDDRIVTVFASEPDHVMYVGVLRVDGNSVWIDEEPVRVDRFVDLKRLDAAALRASATAPAGQGNGR
ncbi:hypothetical protein [Microbacterium oxydans]|uniref:hypothetical protein n=1 Tax=Microbacterium oxydans TaxID=82380 RepID=UPI0024AC82A6|nr:hypothetical protein [Microbacterium oxydans]